MLEVNLFPRIEERIPVLPIKFLNFSSESHLSVIVFVKIVVFICQMHSKCMRFGKTLLMAFMSASSRSVIRSLGSTIDPNASRAHW